jgi:Flp pilus assembly protein TadD
MPAEKGRNPLVGRLSLMLLMGIAGCSTAPGESPRLTATGATGAAAEAPSAHAVEQLVRMGQRSLSSGDAPTAIGLLEQALARDGNSRDAALLLGYGHLAIGAPQDAANAFGRILRRNPNDREAGIGYAKAMLAIGRSEAALAHVQPLSRADPGDVEALNLEGVALDMLGEHGRAVESYRRALAADPKAGNVESNLGLSLALSGRHEEALAVLRPLAEGYVSSPRHRQNLALAYGLAGSFAEAERWSRLDLSQADVENNMRYIQLIRGLAPGTVRSAALKPDFVQPVLIETEHAQAPRASRQLPAAPPPAAQPRPRRAAQALRQGHQVSARHSRWSTPPRRHGRASACLVRPNLEPASLSGIRRLPASASRCRASAAGSWSSVPSPRRTGDSCARPTEPPPLVAIAWRPAPMAANRSSSARSTAPSRQMRFAGPSPKQSPTAPPSASDHPERRHTNNPNRTAFTDS